MREGDILKKVIKKFLRFPAPHIRFQNKALLDKCTSAALDYAS